MTLAACLQHRPVRIVGRGYRCAVCDVEFLVPDTMTLRKAAASRLQCDELTLTISAETQKALDDIDVNIRSAQIRAKDTFLD